MTARTNIIRWFPTVVDHVMLASFAQPPPVHISTEDGLAGVAPRHDAIDRTLEFDPKSSWHARRLKAVTRLSAELYR
jgi:hypothetical protein